MGSKQLGQIINADGIILLSENIRTTSFTCRHWSARQNHNMKTTNKFLENVETKYLEQRFTNLNCSHEETKAFNSGKVWYNSFQSSLLICLISKIIKIATKIHNTITPHVILQGCEIKRLTLSQAYRQNVCEQSAGRKFEPKGQK
jgi:hypothetical protein